jgi:hypothetical protein
MGLVKGSKLAPNISPRQRILHVLMHFYSKVIVDSKFQNVFFTPQLSSVMEQ